MRWKGRKESDNIEDHRGRSGAGFPFPFPRQRGGRGFRIPTGSPSSAKRGGMSFFGLLIAIGVAFLLFKPGGIFQGGQQTNVPSPSQSNRIPKLDLPDMPQFDTTDRQSPTIERREIQFPSAPQQRPQSNQGDELKRFVSVVLKDTEDVWHDMFRKLGVTYQEPKLVIFSDFVQARCGLGQSAMGPFYCPLDQKVYLDLSFYRDLRDRFRAPGDFALAYVVAHEVGHHVQTLLGIAEKVQMTQARVGQRDANRIQVMMELQADCLAGVWAHHAHRTKNILEEGDIEEALNAASKIGDDRIQRQTTGYVVPDSFTHGSSEQRVRWFRRGLETGNPQNCDTFRAPSL